jgi:hypothetical protein
VRLAGADGHGKIICGSSGLGFDRQPASGATVSSGEFSMFFGQYRDAFPVMVVISLNSNPFTAQMKPTFAAPWLRTGAKDFPTQTIPTPSI